MIIDKDQYLGLCEELSYYDDLESILLYELMLQGILIDDVRLLPRERYHWSITRMRSIIKNRSGLEDSFECNSFDGIK